MEQPEAQTIELRTHGSIDDIGRDTWQALLTPETPPFLSYEWLRALEKTGCVAAERGWLPMFLGVWCDGVLAGAAPAYVKGHSMGEFVFDHAWANFAEQHLGIQYYPKLVVAVPFTPATGPRFLTLANVDAQHPPAERLLKAFATALPDLVSSLNLSSAHVLF
jgi:predicted N-acyltransferase